jgi:hypothetical protein
MVEDYHKTSITVRTQYNTVTIEVGDSDLDINAFFRDLIKPALHAVGFTERSIDCYLKCSECRADIADLD